MNYTEKIQYSPIQTTCRRNACDLNCCFGKTEIQETCFLHMPVWFINFPTVLREHHGQFFLGHQMPENFQLGKKNQNNPNNKTALTCSCLIKHSATEVPVVNNYHSFNHMNQSSAYNWIYSDRLIFSCVFASVCIRKTPFPRQAYKEKWRWKLFHYLKRQPITYITFSAIHPSTPNESYDLVRTHS